MPGHDVEGFVNGLSEKLASRSRNVCVLLGAGSSRASGLPDVALLKEKVGCSLPKEYESVFEAMSQGRNLEQILSRVRRISALLAGTTDVVDELSADQATVLDKLICAEIVTQLSVETVDRTPSLRLAAWAARADYHQALEIFTVNYDLLLESGLESLSVPYFDGFVGSLRARFMAELVDSTRGSASEVLPPFMVRLWKLHGSVNWAWDSDEFKEVVRLGGPVPDGRPVAIYPSDAKYDESRRVPFVVLQDRLRHAIHRPESLVLIAGYSFGDAHINELLFDAARRRPRSEFIAFSYSGIPDRLADLALTTPNLQVTAPSEAVLGGIRAGWSSTPGSVPPDVWDSDAFQLGDFAKLTEFLARSSPPNRSLEERLGSLIALAAAHNV